jgi:hypothetical protein
MSILTLARRSGRIEIHELSLNISLFWETIWFGVRENIWILPISICKTQRNEIQIGTHCEKGVEE